MAVNGDSLCNYTLIPANHISDPPNTQAPAFLRDIRINFKDSVSRQKEKEKQKESGERDFSISDLLPFVIHVIFWATRLMHQKIPILAIPLAVLKKGLMLSAVLVFFVQLLRGQSPNSAGGPDSSRIAYIDALISRSSTHYSNEKKDSAKFYAELAYKKSEQNGYAYGAATALLRLTQIVKHFDDDFRQTEELAKKSMEWFGRSVSKKGLDTSYFYLIFSVLSQSRYDEALAYANKLYAFGKETGNAAALQDAMGWQYAIHRQGGDYEKGFIAAENALEFAKSNNKKIWIASALYGMAQLYALIEDYQNALLYFRRVLEMDDNETRSNRIATDNDIWFKMEFAEVFSNLGQYDSAWHYYNLYKPGKGKEQYLRVYWVSTGECYYLQGQYQKALENFQAGLAEHQKLHDRNEVIRTLIDIGKTHLALSSLPILSYAV